MMVRITYSSGHYNLIQEQSLFAKSLKHSSLIFATYIIYNPHRSEFRYYAAQPLPSSLPEELTNQLGDYITIKSRAGICSTPIMEKNNDGRLYLGGHGWAEFVAHHSLSFGNLLLFKVKKPYYFKVFIFDRTATEIEYPTPDFNSQSSNDHSKFNKRMTASDITGRQTIGIPLPFLRENWSSFRCCHEKCYIVVHTEHSEKQRISWNFRDSHWEAALCTGGWKFALNKLKPREGDTVEFKLMFDVEQGVHYFNVSILETQFANGQHRFEAGSSSRNK
ncbi:hypothetical protein ACFE04_027193 [Oxalis oulophora]